MSTTVNLRRLLTALSSSLDFNQEGIYRHHQRVAYISAVLAEELGLTYGEKELTFTASIIHDLGANTWKEKQKLAEFEIEDPWDHCQIGFEAADKVGYLSPAAHIILHHHNRFAGANKSGLRGTKIPLSARIIHLADRVDVLLKPDVHVLKQNDNIIGRITKLSGSVFDPDLTALFHDIGQRESFWLELISPNPLHNQTPGLKTLSIDLNEEEVRQTAEMFAKMIDQKSTFTYRHSRSVTKVAVHLAKAAGFDPEMVFIMEMAGLLHDLGKLSLPDEILEKPDSLTPEEFAVIKQHTYYTFRILQEGGLPSPIPEWAAYHHEKLNGKGYPFHLDASQIPKGSRIMSVADVFTALHEDRPYRQGMKRSEIEHVMYKMVQDSSLDRKMTKLLFEVYNQIEDSI